MDVLLFFARLTTMVHPVHLEMFTFTGKEVDPSDSKVYEKMKKAESKHRLFLTSVLLGK